MPIFCTQCGHRNADDASFCESCGTPLTSASDSQRAAPPLTPGPNARSATGRRPGAIVLGLLSLAIGLAVMTTVHYIFTLQALLGFGFIVVGLVAVVRGMGKRIAWW